MAHSCPDCGCLCHCGGDIDDIEFEENDFCSHYMSSDCAANECDFIDDGEPVHVPSTRGVK